MDINYQKTPYTRWLDHLDKRFGKPWKRELIVLFWLMSSWKTEFTYFVSRKNADKWNKILYISLELPEYDMKLRLARKKAWINKFEFQEQNFTEEQKLIMESEWEKINKNENIRIICPEDKSIWSIVREIRLWYDDWYRFVIIDNLDKIPMVWYSENDRYQKITSELQDYKNNNDWCIVLIHHAKKPDNKWMTYKRSWLTWMRGSQKIMDNATQVFEIYRDLDPDETDKKFKAKVEIIQMKDTFEGANGFEEIYFYKWEYIDEKTYDDKIKNDMYDRVWF